MHTIFTTPTRHYSAPYGSIVNCNLGEDLHVLYIQTAYDDEIPDWQVYSIFLEKALVSFMDNEQFRNECLQLYRGESHVTNSPIISIIKTPEHT